VGLGGLMSDMWTAPEDDPRSYGNPIGEKATYREYLGNYRLTIEMKCEGLDASELARRSVPPSTLSLLGLVRHLAQVENHWFQRVLQGRTAGPRLYQREDEADWDFNGAVADPGVVQDAFATWKAARTALLGGRPRPCANQLRLAYLVVRFGGNCGTAPDATASRRLALSRLSRAGKIAA
jgi:uncharacterized protein DUF664